MKKNILLIGAFILIGSLASCDNAITPDGTVRSKTNTLAFQATASLVAMDNLSTSNVRKAASIGESTKTKIEELLPSIDVLLENGNGFKTELLSSDRNGFEYKQTVSFKDLDSSNKEYVMYYNSIIKTEIEIDDGEEEVEETQRLEGIAIFEEREFNFVGKIEKETEGNEVEETLDFYLNISEGNYIQIKQEIEKENNEFEEEYLYRVVENNRVKYEFSLENENENNLSETEVEITLDNQRFKFDIFTKNNETFIDVRVSGSEEKITYKKIMSTDEANNTVVTFVEV